MTSYPTSMALLIAMLNIGSAGATTVNFSYSGIGNPDADPGATASGSGSFTTDDSNNPAGIADLASFTFSFSLTYLGFTDTYDYGLADLETFQATFSGGSLTGLTLTTDYQPPVNLYFETFNVTGLGTGQAFTFDGDDNASTGTLTIQSSTPEPGTLALTASTLLGLAILQIFNRSRRRWPRKPARLPPSSASASCISTLLNAAMLLAAALLVIGIVPARAAELTGDIAVYNAAGTTLLGYVSKIYDSQNSFTYSANIANALIFEIDSPTTGLFSILEPTPIASSTNEYFAAVGGSGGYDMTPGVDGYAYLSSGSLTASGADPVATPSPASDDLNPYGYYGPEESTIWSNTGQVITPEWVNANGSTSTDVVFYDPVVNYLGVTADLAGYNSYYGDGAVAVTLEFTTTLPNSSAPEPTTGALFGIAVGLAHVIKRRAAPNRLISLYRLISPQPEPD